MTKTQRRSGSAGAQHGGRGLRHAALGLAAALAAVALVGAPPSGDEARAADLLGHDVSWPQCSTAEGGYALPLPPTSSKFTIVGLTKGVAFSENPCLNTQYAWVVANKVPAHAYTMATFPTEAQIDTYGDDGPFNADFREGQLANVGYAEAEYALATLSRVGWKAPVVWIDVEPRPAQPWPGGTEAQKLENRYVIQGLVRRLRDAGVGYGFYSYTNGWQEIAGSWTVPGVPVWATAGTLDYPNEAIDRCTQASFSGGTVYLSQWTDGTRDYNRTCGTYQFTDLPRNLAGVAGVTVTASSVDTDVSPSAASAVDGAVGGYPNDLSMEWSSAQQQDGAWLQLTWPSPVTLDRVVLHDRPNLDDEVLAGVLVFSDGSMVNVGALPNDGGALNVPFSKRAVTSVRFHVTSASANTWAAGLAEMEAWGTGGGTPKASAAPTSAVPTKAAPTAAAPTTTAPGQGANVARVAGVAATASSEDASTGQTAAKAVDGAATGYPTDYTREWATVGGKAGSWHQLTWTTPVTLNRVVLYDRPNDADQVTSGTLTFSDGSTQAFGALNNDGGPTTVTFGSRTTTSLRVSVTGVSGTTENVGLAEIEAWGSETPNVANVARTAGVTIMGSSIDTTSGQTAIKAVDGVATGYPTDYTREWATVGGKAGSWLQLNWASPVSLTKVVLYDRPNTADQITGGTLTFSDGTTQAFGALNNEGAPATISFNPRTTTSLRLTITGVSGTTENVGLAEIEAWGTVANATNMARASGVSATASSQDSGSGQTAAKSVDVGDSLYPTDYTREWATVGGKDGSWLQLNWNKPVSLNKVVLFDRPNDADQITGGTLTFSDGTTQAFGALNNDGTATTITFGSRTTTSLRMTITHVSGTTENVGLAEIEAWGSA